MVMDVSPRENSKREVLTTLRLPMRFTQNELLDLVSKIGKLQSEENGCSSEPLYRDKKTIAVANARILLHMYGTRETSFPQGNFSDPGWQLLLDLFVQQASGKNVNVSSACLGSRAPSTTALRYISDYIEKGLLIRTPSKHDQRVYWLSLSDAALSELTDLFSDDFM